VGMCSGRRPEGFEDERVALSREVELFVARAGTGASRSLLVIHGGPGWDHTYLRVPVDRLGGSFHLLLPDLRGCGRSTVGLADDSYTPDLAVADLIALLDVLGVDRCSVLGFSYGGLLAQRLAVEIPARVERLIVASSSVLTCDMDALDRLGAGTRAADADPVWTDPSVRDADRGRVAAIAAAEYDVYRTEARADYLARVQEIRFSEDWARPWQAGILPPAGLENAIQQLAATDVPVLLIQGRHDGRFPAAHALEAADRLPAAQAVVINDAAHMAHIDQPHAWLSAITTFLDTR
jgi:pimeloyl-ACP methyl ester carboxylesterase